MVYHCPTHSEFQKKMFRILEKSHASRYSRKKNACEIIFSLKNIYEVTLFIKFRVKNIIKIYKKV